MSYRRAWPSPIWHWRVECASWPTEKTIAALRERPSSGLFCTECARRDLEDEFHVQLPDEAAAATIRALKAGRLYG